jgi:mRNA-degrading endonuclease RelE of RelBE toxin-antitoxin system
MFSQMSWRVIIRPQVEDDVAGAAEWYNVRQPGLGADFIEEIIQVWDQLRVNPLMSARRHPSKNIRWRYPDRFPYRVIYEVVDAEHTVIVLAVLHAARHDDQWRHRL